MITKVYYILFLFSTQTVYSLKNKQKVRTEKTVHKILWKYLKILSYPLFFISTVNF